VARALVCDVREHRAHPPRPGAPRSADRAADPLHLALVFGPVPHHSSKYRLFACGLLDGQPAEAAEAEHEAPGGPGAVPESSGVEGQRPGSRCVLPGGH